jgi:prophage regulatory protein
MYNTKFSQLIKTPLLRLPEVLSDTGTSRSFVYAGVKNGTFPAPIKIGKRAVAWTAESIDAWIACKSNGAKS